MENFQIISTEPLALELSTSLKNLGKKKFLGEKNVSFFWHK